MQIPPRSPNLIIKGVNDCFFEIESMCQHIESEFEICPDTECESYKPCNQLKKQNKHFGVQQDSNKK